MKLRASPVPALAKFAIVLGPAMIAFGIWAFIQSGIIDQDEEGLAAGGMFAFWGIVIGVVGLRTKRHGVTYVEIDEERGMLSFVEERVTRGTIPLHELGELSVSTVRSEHQLTASALPKAILFRSPTLLPLQQRRAQLERIAAIHAIRNVLSNDAPGDGAFRDDPELAFRVRAAVPDRVRRDEALAALAKDPRVEILQRQLADERQ